MPELAVVSTVHSQLLVTASGIILVQPQALYCTNSCDRNNLLIISNSKSSSSVCKNGIIVFHSHFIVCFLASHIDRGNPRLKHLHQ